MFKAHLFLLRDDLDLDNRCLTARKCLVEAIQNQTSLFLANHHCYDSRLPLTSFGHNLPSTDAARALNPWIDY